MIKVSPSILAADFSKLADELKSIENAGADMVHLDVMDGNFVSNISFGIPVIESIRKITDMVFDVHLMIDKPERYVERFASVGADIITFHIEATEDPKTTVDLIHKCGKKAGISIRPNTPVEVIYPYLTSCEMVLIMTVEPGYGGQSLIPETISKIAALRDEISCKGLDIDVQVDGGINSENVGEVVAAGANIIVAGSSVFKYEDRAEAIRKLR